MMDEFQIASAEFVAADAEYERLRRIKPLPVEAWDASDRCYEAHKKLWLMFGGSPCNVPVNIMFNQYCERLLKPHKADA